MLTGIRTIFSKGIMRLVLIVLMAILTLSFAIWGIGDIYPRYRCDYNLPRKAPTEANFPEPFRNTYCLDDDPALLVRGARNAPRPPGDDTAGPPPGQDPLAVTDKSPDIPPYTIPTPYGGPVMPVPMPN